MARAGMWVGLEMETLADRSDAHIAEIVIQGHHGVIEMTKALNTHDGADPDARPGQPVRGAAERGHRPAEGLFAKLMRVGAPRGAHV